MIGRLPTFLIIGAQKSGTTGLAHLLGKHPEVFMSERKELHFFDLNFDNGLEWYSSFFAPARGEAQLGEATPSYLFEPVAIRRLADVLSSARLLVTLRNPVDRAYSHYWHNRARGAEPLGFANALSAEVGRITDADMATRHRFSYLARGLYVDQLEEVLAHFPRSSLHVEIAEETQREAPLALTRICHFLGVDPELLSGNTKKRIGSYSEFRSVRLRELSQSLPDPLAKPLKRLNHRTDQKYPPMDQEIRAKLESAYKASNERLAVLLGRPNLWPGA